MFDMKNNDKAWLKLLNIYNLVYNARILLEILQWVFVLSSCLV